jgi:hypothetical protein
MRNTFTVLFGKRERKRLLGRPRRTREDNIKMDLEWSGRKWARFICLRIGTSGDEHGNERSS